MGLGFRCRESVGSLRKESAGSEGGDKEREWQGGREKPRKREGEAESK